MTNSEAAGDAVEAAARALPSGRLAKPHDVDLILRPDFELRTLPGLEDYSSSLSWGALARVEHAMLYVWARVGIGPRGLAREDHVLIMDTWRDLLFLGVGEMTEEWHAGLLGLDPHDREGRILDERLANRLRVHEVMAVRVVHARVEREPAAKKPKLSKYQRKKLKRDRQET